MSERRLYLEPMQAATGPATAWENELADAIEAAFAEGHWELSALVERLNRSRVRPPAGGAWTEAAFTATMRELGA